MATWGTTAAQVTYSEDYDGELRIPVNVPGKKLKVWKGRIFIDIQTGSENAYATGGLSLSTLLTAAGIAGAAEHKWLLAHSGPLFPADPTTKAFTRTKRLETEVDKVNNKLMLFSVTLDASPGSDVEMLTELPNTTDIEAQLGLTTEWVGCDLVLIAEES